MFTSAKSFFSVSLVRQTAYSVVEELLEFFVGVVDAELLKAVELENLKASDIQDANEAGSLSLGAVQ